RVRADQPARDQIPQQTVVGLAQIALRPAAIDDAGDVERSDCVLTAWSPVDDRASPVRNGPLEFAGNDLQLAASSHGRDAGCDG
ncbi:hypothetical protein, partial [Klebsiella pneumoniae]|uniref:hypothetical protein n=1 Tax=Klebsiella pneumoniae TaxID=573 RepID=UPI001D0F1943